MDSRGYKKRAARISTRCEAVLTEADGCKVDVVITEVSRDGFRLQSRAELIEGDEVVLQVGSDEPMRAKIQWTRGLEAGGQFLDPPGL